jgi:hypothetical protein
VILVGQINPAHLAQARSDAERNRMISIGRWKGRTYSPLEGPSAPEGEPWYLRRLSRLSEQKPWLWGKYAGAFSGALVGAHQDAAPGVLP